MISEKMQSALNEQLNMELYSSYLYLSMAAYFSQSVFKGFAHWMDFQAKEELSHGRKFYDYIKDSGAAVNLGTIKAPKTIWKSPAEPFEEALEHEIIVTESITALSRLAEDERDKPTELFLNYFINEQVEEVNSVRYIIEKFKYIGEHTNGLFMLDKELLKRV